MSVLVNKRTQSPLLTLDTACFLRRDLTVYMIKYFCKDRLCKETSIVEKGKQVKIKEFYPEEVVETYKKSVLYLLKELVSYLARANAIYPTTLEDIARREVLQKKAIEVCTDLQTELNCIVLVFTNQINGFLSFADRLGSLVHQIKNWKKANKKFEERIKKQKGLSCVSTNFCNANNNGNANNNLASNSDNGVAPDFEGSE